MRQLLFTPAILMTLLGPAAMPARAERHLWDLPGSNGFKDARWDASTCTFVGLEEKGGEVRVLRLDPLSGERTLLAALALPELPDDADDDEERAFSAGLRIGEAGEVELFLGGGPGTSSLVTIRPGVGAGPAQVESLPVPADRRLQVKTLVKGADGRRYVLEEEDRQISVLTPELIRIGDAEQPGLELTPLQVVMNPGGGAEAKDEPTGGDPGTGVEALCWRPQDLAAAPDGSLWVADGDGKQLLRLVPSQDPLFSGWTGTVMAGNGDYQYPGPDSDAWADVMALPMGPLDGFRMGQDGRIYVATYGRLLEFLPHAEPGRAGWSGRRIGGTRFEGRLAALSQCPSISFFPSGPHGSLAAPAAPAPTPWRSGIPSSEAGRPLGEILDLLPGDMILLKSPKPGAPLCILGPGPTGRGSSDASLADLVRQAREARRDGRAERLQAIVASLRKHIHGRARNGSYPVQQPALKRSGHTFREVKLAALPKELEGLVESFLDGLPLALRATLALAAIEEGNPSLETKGATPPSTGASLDRDSGGTGAPSGPNPAAQERKSTPAPSTKKQRI